MMEKFLPTGVVSISQLPALPRSAMSKRTSSESDPESSSASGVLSDTKKQKGESLILFQSMIAEKDEKIQKFVKTKKTLQQTVRRQQAKISKLEEELKQEKAAKQTSLDIKRVADKSGTLGKSGSWLTPSGAVSLAVAFSVS